MRRYVVDTKTIIVNLLKEDQKDYLSVDRLLSLMRFIYNELSTENKLDDYRIAFDINFYSIERTVQYNNDLFDLDLDGKTLRLRKRNSESDLADKYKIDSTLQNIIAKFSAA